MSQPDGPLLPEAADEARHTTEPASPHTAAPTPEAPSPWAPLTAPPEGLTEHIDQARPDEQANADVEVKGDDFLRPQEVIQAREALRIRHGRCPTCMSRLVTETEKKDSASLLREEAAWKGISPLKDITISVEAPAYGDTSSIEEDEDTIVAWEDGDRENPHNWSGQKKAGVLIMVMMLIVNSTMGSALPSIALPFITAEWHIRSQTQAVLPMSVYLIGYVMGPLLWAPLSEQYGRRRLTLGTFAMFVLSTLACALAPNWPAFLVFRLLAGVFASAPIAVVPGIIADTNSDPRARGRSMGFFFATTLMGPLFAPVISGYCSTTIGWRWAFWIGLIYAGLTMLFLIFLPETFSPVLLLRRAKSIRKHDPTARVVAPHELERKSAQELVTVVLTRPIRMILFELIVTTSCTYLALCYAIFYMFFEAFPIIFSDLYQLSPGETGLTYLSIGVGCLLALPVFFTYDNILSAARARNAPWTRQEESRRLPLACVGGPLFALSLFWLGFASHHPIPFWVPMLAGIPFGLGFMCIFQALLNYMTDAYEIFAASANAAASCSRSLLATVLPLATAPMFARLGIAGACSLLGGLATLMCVIPFIFLWQGERIRAGSQFCIAIRARREKMARKIDEQRRRKMMRLASAGIAIPAGATGVAYSGSDSSRWGTPSTGGTTQKWSGTSTPMNSITHLTKPVMGGSSGTRMQEEV